MNKIYCRKHRGKEKQYVKDLEIKVENLEKQVVELQEQIVMLKTGYVIE